MKNNCQKKIKKFQRSPGLFLFDMHLIQALLTKLSEKKQRKLRKLMLHPKNFFRDMKLVRLFFPQNHPPKITKSSKRQKRSAPIALAPDFRFFQEWSKKETYSESPILFFWGPNIIAKNIANLFPEWRVLSPAPGITWPQCWQLLSEYLEKDEYAPIKFLLWTAEEYRDVKYFAQHHEIPLCYIYPGLLGGFPQEQGVFLSCFIDDINSIADKEQSALQKVSIKNEHLIDEARRIMDLMRFLGITSLPATSSLTCSPIETAKQIVLVLGSRSADSPEDKKTLELAKKEYPDTDIVYIPHDKEKSAIYNDDFALLLNKAVHVYTFDSLLGMDALIRRIPLTVLGQPFYAGYGLTDDRNTALDRKETFSLEELFIYIYFYKQTYIYKTSPEEGCLTAVLFMAYKRWMLQWEAGPQSATGEEESAANENWQKAFSPLQLKSLFNHAGENILQYLPLSRLLKGQHWEFAYLIGCYLIGQLKPLAMVPVLLNQLRDILPQQAFHALEQMVFFSGVTDALSFTREAGAVQPENCKIIDIQETGNLPKLIAPSRYDFFIKQAQQAYAKRNLKESWQLCATLLISGCAAPAIFDLLVEIYYIIMDFTTSTTIYSCYISFERNWRIPSYHLHGMQSALQTDQERLAWRAFLCYLGLSQRLPSIIPYINGINKTREIHNLLKASLGLYCAGSAKGRLDLATSYLNNCNSTSAEILLRVYRPTTREISLYMQTYCRILLLENRNEDAYQIVDRYISLVPTPANFNFLIFCIANSTNDTGSINRYYKLAQQKGISLSNSVKYRICAVNSMIREFFHYYAEGIYEGWKKIVPEESFIKSLKGDCSHSEAVVLMGYSIGETCFFAGQLRNLASYYSQRLHFVCDARLFPLLHRTFPDLSFIPTARMYRFATEMKHLEEFSQLPRLDLAAIMTNEVIPHWKRTNCFVWIYNLFADMIREQSTVPRNEFLVCDPHMAQTWERKLANKTGNKIRVAICWRSALEFVDTKNYIFTLEDLRPLLDEERIQLIDCQYTGLTEEEKTFLETHYPGKLLSFAELDLHDDLDGTAAMLSQVDCVISIPNSLGTQAAALGKHTYLLSSCQPGYFLEEENSGHSYFLPHAELVYPDSGEGKQSVARKIRDRILAQYSNNQE